MYNYTQMHRYTWHMHTHVHMHSQIDTNSHKYVCSNTHTHSWTIKYTHTAVQQPNANRQATADKRSAITNRNYLSQCSCEPYNHMHGQQCWHIKLWHFSCAIHPVGCWVQITVMTQARKQSASHWALTAEGKWNSSHCHFVKYNSHVNIRTGEPFCFKITGASLRLAVLDFWGERERGTEAIIF